MPKTAQEMPPGLVRGLGVWSAAAVVVGGTIGTGIFLVPSQMARDVGSAWAVTAVWLAGGVVILFGVFCYAELGAALPEAGGEYVYLSRALGPLWGFLFGWKGSVLSYPAIMATVAAGLLRFGGFLMPSLSRQVFTWSFSIPLCAQPFSWTMSKAQLWSAVAIVVVAAVNYFGVRTAGRTQVVLTSLKVGVLLAIVILGIALAGGGTTQTNGNVGSQAAGGLSGYFLALVSAMWAYSGFSDLGLVGGEVLNPQRSIPRAAILGVVSVVSLYVAVNVIYFHVLGISRVAESQHVASDVAVSLIGEQGARWLTVGMIISSLGALHAQFLKFPRVAYAMARDGRFFHFAQRVQPTFRTPSAAILFEACLAIILVLTGTFEELYSTAVFAVALFELLIAVAVIRLRGNEPSLPRPYRAWGFPWTAFIFGVVVFGMVLNLWLARPIRCSIGLTAILLGIPFYRHWSKEGGGTFSGSATYC
jgi:APA family basic amino acid/polyamine antiporter